MISLARKIYSDSFVQNSFVFFVGSFIVAVVNYLYYPVMSRVLSIEDFGEVQVIVTILLQITVVLNVFGYIAVNLFGNLEDEEKRTGRVRNLEGAAIIIVAACGLLALAFSGYIDSYLKIGSVLVVATLALVFVVNVPFTIKSAWLQAQSRFKEISLANLISGSAKILLALPLIAMGLGVDGALFGLIAATFLSLAFVSWRAYTNFRLIDHLGENYFRVIIRDPVVRQDLRYGALIFCALFSINVLYSADVILVRRFFSVTDAGLYSGITVIGRIIFFSTFAISAVLLPSIRLTATARQNSRNLQKALLLTILLDGFFLILFLVSPETVVKVLIGSKYLEFSGLLFRVGLFILLASLLNVLFVYAIALRKMFVSLIGIVASVSVFALSYLNNASIPAVVNNFIIINALALSVTAAYLVLSRKRIGAVATEA
ncbi:MAG: lipopolysaccharide biosynthesis protein [Thermoleophilia bacterium]